MSRTEFHIGILKPLHHNQTDDDVESFFETKCRIHGFDKNMDTWQESYYDKRESSQPEYFISFGTIYYVIDKEYEYDVSHFREEANGDIHYALSFYNGGTYFSEMIEEGLKKMQ